MGEVDRSKREITKILTGKEPPPLAPGEPLANDILRGAPEISAFTGLSASQVYHYAPRLKLRRLAKVVRGRVTHNDEPRAAAGGLRGSGLPMRADRPPR